MPNSIIPNNMFDQIPKNGTNTVALEYIVYKKFAINYDSSTKDVSFGFSVQEVFPTSIFKIDDFIKEKLTPPAFLTLRSGGSSAVTTPYDIDVRRPSYVVIELSGDHNWQFAGDYAMSTKAAATGRTNGLWHAWVDASGKIQTAETISGVSGCRLIYFEVRERGAYGTPTAGEHVNLHIEFLQGNQRLLTIADPDIKNDGSQPYPP